MSGCSYVDTIKQRKVNLNIQTSYPTKKMEHGIQIFKLIVKNLLKHYSELNIKPRDLNHLN